MVIQIIKKVSTVKNPGKDAVSREAAENTLLAAQ
jgi:hypothetical protein